MSVPAKTHRRLAPGARALGSRWRRRSPGLGHRQPDDQPVRHPAQPHRAHGASGPAAGRGDRGLDQRPQPHHERVPVALRAALVQRGLRRHRSLRRVLLLRLRRAVPAAPARHRGQCRGLRLRGRPGGHVQGVPGDHGDPAEEDPGAQPGLRQLLPARQGAGERRGRRLRRQAQGQHLAARAWSRAWATSSRPAPRRAAPTPSPRSGTTSPRRTRPGSRATWCGRRSSARAPRAGSWPARTPCWRP